MPQPADLGASGEDAQLQSGQLQQPGGEPGPGAGGGGGGYGEPHGNYGGTYGAPYGGGYYGGGYYARPPVIYTELGQSSGHARGANPLNSGDIGGTAPIAWSALPLKTTGEQAATPPCRCARS